VDASCRDVELNVAGTGRMLCYLALPARPNGAALVVLQEIFGVNAYIRSVVDSFADAGFVTIAPDLFWRQTPGVQLSPADPADRERATALMKGLDTQLALADATAAVKFAQGQLQATAPALAVGYCLGGKLSFLLAATGAVEAAVSYYGVGIHQVLADAGRIKGRVLLHVAQADPLCPPDAQAEIARALTALGTRAQVLTYPGVGHAFARPGGAGFNQEATAQADRATLAFLRQGLPAGH
jgi:carboxymethylenebutenolidase